MSESPPLKLNIENDNFISKLTFRDLSERNISSKELYSWSAPIDIIENYQIYLINKTNSSLSNEIYYNCTNGRFGRRCEYELVYYDSSYSSLYEIIYNFYESDVFTQSTLTCYVHLKCNGNLCLDWSEIYDGEMNCLNGADEEHCFELKMNECDENEYRCKNGQCIPKSFYKDDLIFRDCIDQSDSYLMGR
jgi:hypothetical protein